MPETATWEIPYPDGTDTLCDGYLFTQAIAERVDEILDDFDESLSLTEVRPLARVSTTVSQLTNTAGEVVFGQVDFDTANLAAQYLFGSVTAPAESFIVIGASGVWAQSPAAAGNPYGGEIIAPASGQSHYFTQVDRGNGTRGAWAQIDYSTFDFDIQVPVHYMPSTTNPVTVAAGARLWIHKWGIG